MILIMAGTRDIRAFSSMVQFARHLDILGLPVVIDEQSLPESIEPAQKFEFARFLIELDPTTVEHVLIIGSGNIDNDVLQYLHAAGFGEKTRFTAIGSFPDAQSKIGAQSKLAFALGREPEIWDLLELQPAPLLESQLAPMVYSGKPENNPDTLPTLLIYVPKKLLKGNHWLGHLDMLSNSPDFNCHVVTEAQGKERINSSRFTSISTFSISEIPPDSLAQIADIVVFFGENVPGSRMGTLALEILGKGGALLDCTTRAAFALTPAPAIRGPADIAGLEGFLKKTVLPNLAGIQQDLAGNTWLQQHSAEKLAIALDLKGPARKPPTGAKQTLFIPTNGVGLGHAQRCSQIAGAMDSDRKIGFAAFPSCVPMLQSKGFDCLTLVQKSENHIDPFANDLLNYMRLHRTVNAGEHLVFDGGYVFSGIYRLIFERRLSATWIRRGLWQAGQTSRTPLERERAFDQVIIPQEAFGELNTDYSFGNHIHKVGPIVQSSDLSKPDKSKLRAKLKKQFGRDFKSLVVSMLGGGIAADRSTQLQAISAQIDAQPDRLHLIVVWPNGSVSASLFGWNNTFVVRTHRALELCQAADFVISAGGYNSIHELMYHGVPSILIPQMSSFMDNQEQRALAASQRGLASTVMADELLSLKREVDAFLDGGKAEEVSAALKEAKLPETGNVAAAQLIERMGK